MSEPFLGEIRLFGFNFPPQGWAFCNGKTLSILQNQPLYTLLGSAFGPSSLTHFTLPDLRGRIPMYSTTDVQGTMSGQEFVTLDTNTMPSHSHYVMAHYENANSKDPKDHVLSKSGQIYAYANPFDTTDFNEATIGNTGHTQGHYNIQPSLAVNFCIALTGVYPQRKEEI